MFTLRNEIFWVNYWETYTPVVNSKIVSSLLSIRSVHKIPIISIEFVINFPQDDFDVDVFMELPLGMGVDEKTG